MNCEYVANVAGNEGVGPLPAQCARRSGAVHSAPLPSVRTATTALTHSPAEAVLGAGGIEGADGSARSTLVTS